MTNVNGAVENETELKQYDQNEFREESIDDGEISLDNSSTNVSNEYKQMVSLLKESENFYNEMLEITKNEIEESYHVKSSILDEILHIPISEVKNMEYTNLEHIFKQFGLYDDTIDMLLKEYRRPYPDGENLSEVGVLRHVMQKLKEAQQSIITSKEELDSLKKESGDVLNEYINYKFSGKSEKMREERLMHFKELLVTETDEVKVAKMKKMIDAMEQSKTLSFLFSRIQQYGLNEVNTIMEAFFDQRKGSYVIDKFKGKVSKFGFDSNTYRFFFNLEENFLPEEYHVYNNLFLFCYMRMVAYSDPYNKVEKLWVQSLTENIIKLIYHKFSKTENELQFIAIIKKNDDQFDVYRNRFEKDNTTAPGHKVRINYHQEYEENRKKELIAEMDKLHISGYNSDMSVKELHEHLNTELDKLIKMNSKSYQEKYSESSKNSSTNSTDDDSDNSTEDDGFEPDVNIPESETPVVYGISAASEEYSEEDVDISNNEDEHVCEECMFPTE